MHNRNKNVNVAYLHWRQNQVAEILFLNDVVKI